MQVENLTDKQANMAGVFFDAMGEPVTHKTYGMEDMNFAKRLTAIEESLSDIERKLELVFGNHVLVKGNFVDLHHQKKNAMKKAGFNHAR